MVLLKALGCSAAVGAAILRYLDAKKEERTKSLFSDPIPMRWAPPAREDVLSRIRSPSRVYDLVVVGGGSAGAGCALDAATRGYSVLLLEKNDFASGTSSKSTKLIHGGIRYLEKAIKDLDYKQLALVLEGLRERRTFLNIAPHLTKEVGILLPIKNKYLIPYFWAGTKMYDALSGAYSVQKSYFLPKKSVSKMFPTVDIEKLAGCMVYFDGQMVDTRVNVMLAETAAYYGADVLNYANVTSLVKNNGKIVGIRFKNEETQEAFSVKCRGVINATGPESDLLRTLDNPSAKRVMAPSKGVHIVLEKGHTGQIGLLNPSTKNGSVLFVLPWNGVSIAGTTDTYSDGAGHPIANRSDIRYIVQEMSEFVDKSVRPKAKNILSAWAGIRPLARDPAAAEKGSTSLVRSHLVETSPSGLVTITGGKWTSYREMAEQTVTHCASLFSLSKRECHTRYVKLIGAHRYSEYLPLAISREFGVSEDTAAHLVAIYGDRARKVCLQANGSFSRIHPRHPHILAEVEYAISHEHARKIPDYLGRRSMLSYVDVRGAHESVKAVGEEFRKYLGWSRMQLEKEIRDAHTYLDTMGYALLKGMEEEELKATRLKSALNRECASDLLCTSRTAAELVEKYFGSAVAQGLVGSFRRKAKVSISEAMEYVSDKLDLL